MAKRKPKKGPTRSKKPPQAPEQPDPFEILVMHLNMEERLSAFIDRYRKERGEDPPLPLMQTREYLFNQIPNVAIMARLPGAQLSTAPPPKPEAVDSPPESQVVETPVEATPTEDVSDE